MGYIITTSKPNKAMRLARKLVKANMDWADLEGIISESLKISEHRELLTAIRADYVKKENRIREIDREVDALGNPQAEKLFSELSDLNIDQAATQQIASFQLGYATALRVLGMDKMPTRSR